jgi:hypothetical protein
MKQTIKTTNKDNLRGTGIGSLDWSESCKLHSTAKRLVSTFDTPVKEKSKKNKIEVVCTKCHGKFKTNNGKLPKHIDPTSWRWIYRRGNEEDTSTPSVKYCDGEILLDINKSLRNEVKEIEINNIVFNIGDTVLVEIITVGNYRYGITDKKQIEEKIIEKIIVKDNSYTIYFKRKNEFEKYSYITSSLINVFNLEIIKL